jgi:ribosomal protein S18 acetylase RimI-like enzyme
MEIQALKSMPLDHYWRVIEIRAMGEADVEDAALVWHRAYPPVAERYRLPVPPQTPEAVQRTVRSIGHLLETDPQSSWVAVDSNGAIVAVAQALRRQETWVLSMLGVEPSAQDAGTGRALLDRTLHGLHDVRHRMILASRDPRAMHCYARAGLELHPSLQGHGRVRRPPPACPAVSIGSRQDVPKAAELARVRRGGSNEPDLHFLLDGGRQLWTHPAGGYAVAQGGSLSTLAAESEAIATDLLETVLAQAGPDEVVDIDWMTGAHQWAIRICVEAGLELFPAGAVMTDSPSHPTPLYLPHGAFG